jgi:aminoglycoside phosphotransferase (APT) family kinase protein
MNTVSTYLAEHREPLELDALGVGRDPAFVLITPRFAQSAHVVMLVLGEDGRPVLAAKLPRRAGFREELARETANLRAAGKAFGDDGSVPQVVAFDEDLAHPLLLQRALLGTPLSTSVVRRDRAGAVAKVAAWCGRLAAATAHPGQDADYERVVLGPLRTLAGAWGPGGVVGGLARATLPLAERLVEARPPVVFEHGDLGHPNLILAPDGRLGVIDFERAEHGGMPGHDLAFFCAYAASAAAPRKPLGQAVADAFGGRRPWAREAMSAHLRALGIAPDLDDALLAVACARVVAQAHSAKVMPKGGARDAGGRHLALWQRLVSPAPATPHVWESRTATA